MDASLPVALGGAGIPATIRRVLVLGAGRSGIGAALALAGLGLEVILSDRRNPEALPALRDVLAAGARFVPEEALASSWPAPDLVVKSPGVPGEAGPVVLARGHGVPVWSELELAFALLPNPFDAITGTNGKTTTTALLGHLFETAGRPARVLGNIGVAVTSAADEIRPGEEVVVEVSSFQLEDIHSFRPAVGVFLNLTPDHLDRHGTLERYLACKAKLFANQRPGDIAVLNWADPAVAALGAELAARPAGPRVAFFSVAGPGKRGAETGPAAPGAGRPGPTPAGAGTARAKTAGAEGAPPAGAGAEGTGLDSWVEDGWLFLEREPLLPIADIRIPGLHNLENCLAAGTAALARGVARGAVAEGLRTFPGVAHRLEMAGMVRGVTYVNDSKATNVEATLTALNAYPENTHLILGGRDKASDYRPVARACARGCKGVYLIGEATPLIAEAFAEVQEREGLSGVPEVCACGDLEAAVRTAAGRAVPGDVVLLAPACASFDQYGSFEERGAHFRTLVAELAGEKL
jgi:UDP-N-acetylmuramoylalanine--D-glutamate ligase